MSAPTGMVMQGRLLDVLRADPSRVRTKDELVRALRLRSRGLSDRDASRTLDALALKAATECKKGGCPYPVNVWGVGYKMSNG